MNYKSNRVGSVCLSPETDDNLIISSHVDNLGYGTLSFGRSMTIRLDCNDLDKLRELLDMTVAEVDFINDEEQQETEEVEIDISDCLETRIDPFDWIF